MDDNEFIIQDEIEQAKQLIIKEAPELVVQLMLIINNDGADEDGRPWVDSRTKLQAIGMLLDRVIPKLAVQPTKSDEIEETSGRKKMKSEIEEMIRKELGKGE